jgi:hypothetical protein
VARRSDSSRAGADVLETINIARTTRRLPKLEKSLIIFGFLICGLLK